MFNDAADKLPKNNEINETYIRENIDLENIIVIHSRFRISIKHYSP